MRIVVFGIPEFGGMLVETLKVANKDVVAIVLPPRGNSAYNATKMMANAYNVPYISVGKNINDPAVAEKIKSYSPDLILIASYPKLIPPQIYNIPPLGTINCHPSLLPLYRGSNPYVHVIRNGELETGITYHYVDDTYDTGDVIAQWRVPLLPNETLGTLYFRLSYKAAKLYLEVLEKIEKEGRLHAVKQPEINGNILTSPEVKDGNPYTIINWNDSAVSIERQIRSLNPFFSAITKFRNLRFRIWSANIVKNTIFKPSSQPGTIVKVSNNEMVVSASDGLISLNCVQYGMFYLSDIKEFITRNDPKVGEILN
ncbi:MAG: methionyl-tRNA formyltransferase [Vampirovibrionia bacterium]